MAAFTCIVASNIMSGDTHFSHYLLTLQIAFMAIKNVMTHPFTYLKNSEHQVITYELPLIFKY